MIPKSGNRFSEKIMLQENVTAAPRFNLKQNRSSEAQSAGKRSRGNYACGGPARRVTR
jgi:hypothetical protein